MNNKLLLFRLLGTGNFSSKLTVECSSKVVLGTRGCGRAAASTDVTSVTISSSALTDWGAVEGFATAGDTPGVGDGTSGVGDGTSGVGDGILGVGDGTPGVGDGTLGVGAGASGIGDGAPSGGSGAGALLSARLAVKI